jgi:TolB-like protein/Tfp pilus assembly protein PilF
MMNFFDELKRRNVIKETLAYLVVSWVILQVISLVLPIFDAPDWVLKTVTFLLALGLPFWIFFSWTYQVTSDGFKKTTEIREKPSVIAGTNKRLNIIIIITLIIAIGVTLIQKPTTNTATNELVSNDLTSYHSIAVLPFTDYSPGKDEPWLSEGMTKNLIHELRKINSLTVPSTTTMKTYKETDKTLPEIARELNVGALLEGSTERRNDSVRITTSLINADDKSLWSQDYDVAMEEFNVLGYNISQKIVKELKLVLTPADSARFKMPSRVDPKALEADLKGMHILSWFHTMEELEMATEYFKSAINIDSTYASAYAHLAASYLSYPYLGGKNISESSQLAEEANKKALKLNPQLTEAHLNEFKNLYYYKWDWDGAFSAYEKVIELKPNNPEVLYDLMFYYMVSGKFDKAFQTCNKIRQIEPASNLYWYNKAIIQFHSRDLEGSLKTIEEGLKLYPDFYGLLELRSWCLSVLGRHEEAVSSYKKFLSFLEGKSSAISNGVAGWVFARAGLRKEALKQLDIVAGPGAAYCDPIYIGMIHMGLGDKDRAMEYFYKSYQEHSLEIVFLKRAPVFDPMRGDPRFEKLIQDLKFP